MNEYQEISPGVCVDNYQNRVDCKTGKVIPYTPPSVPNTTINSAFSTFGNQNTLAGTSNENSVFSNNTFNPSMDVQGNLPTAPVNPEMSKYYKIDENQKGAINDPSINNSNNKSSVKSNSKYYPYIAPIAALNTGLAYFSELTRQNRSKQYEQNNLSNPYNGILGFNTAKQTYDVSGSPFTNYYNYKKGGLKKECFECEGSYKKKMEEGGDYLDEYLDEYLNTDDSKKKNKTDNSAPSEEELSIAKEREDNDLWQQYNNDLAAQTMSLYGDRKRNRNDEESYSGQNATVAPNDAINSVAAYYMNKGYDKSFVAGVLGNIHAESGGNSSVVGDNGNAFGLFQHNGPRKKALFNFAKKNSLDPSDPLTQAMFAETEPEFKKAYSKSRGSSPEESARIFENTFEKPGIKRSKARASAASQFYPLLK